MAEHTQLIDAINIRTSVRAYDADPIDDDTARQLSMTLDAVNMLSDTHMQLVRDQPAIFAEANASGHLTNAANLIAVIGPKDDPQARERAGFYAERVVLTATLRGLGTLWVGGSWNRDEAAGHCQAAFPDRRRPGRMGVGRRRPVHPQVGEAGAPKQPHTSPGERRRYLSAGIGFQSGSCMSLRESHQPLAI